jgi:hypothetical protein
MQRAIQLLLVFLLFALATIGAGALVGIRIGGLAERFGAGPDRGPVSTRQPGTAEQLREVQDGYLGRLRANPADAAAMRGLVAVRRRMAGDDPVVLRRQAAAYQQMIASGAESPEHYPRTAMELLARGCLQAAAAVESEQRSAAQRARAGGPQSAPGAPRDKGAFVAPALPSAPAQGGKGTSGTSAPAPRAPSNTGPATLPSQARPGQAGAAPSSPSTEPPAAPSAHDPTPEPPATPAPASPPPPPTGSTPPQQPAGGSPVAPPASPGGTIAVVPPQAGGPELATSEGNLAQVDCQNKTFVLHGANGDEEYLAAPIFTIYVRGTKSERLSDFCALKRHIGRAAMVWSVPGGDRKVAKSMSVVLPTE